MLFLYMFLRNELLMRKYMFVKDRMGYLLATEKTKIVCSSHFQKEQTWHVRACSGMLSKSWGIQATSQPCTILWV